MKISFEDKGKHFIFTIDGPIDIASVQTMKDYFRDHMGKKIPAVILDLENVEYVDSLGLATLISVFKGFIGDDSQVAIVNLSPKVDSLFRITKVDQVLDIHHSIELAEQSFQK